MRRWNIDVLCTMQTNEPYKTKHEFENQIHDLLYSSDCDIHPTKNIAFNFKLEGIHNNEN